MIACKYQWFLRITAIGIAMSALAPCILPACVAQQIASAKVRTAFNEDCETLALREIRKAKKQIRGAVYIITNRDLTGALVEAAKDDDVDVQLKVDRHQAKGDAMRKAIDRLRSGGVSVITIDMPPYYHMHHKFLVIDGETTLTGSYNFTVAASEVNYENLVAIQSTTVARSYAVEYERIKSKKKR